MIGAADTPTSPAPVAELSAGMVWDWDEAEAWARSTGRL